MLLIFINRYLDIFACPKEGSISHNCKGLDQNIGLDTMTRKVYNLMTIMGIIQIL